MSTAIEFVTGILAGYPIGTIGGWLMYRDSLASAPINWRILIGPWCYRPWVERQGR